ncbi:DNA repair protein RecO [bacterium]|nr:DNA repair protein RecO [bacterium]
MPSLIRSDGIVLRTVRHGETSLILTVFMRETGRVGLMAKGVRSKTRHGLAAGLEIFRRAQFVYYHKPSRDLQLLREWSVLAPHQRLRDDLDCLAVASAVVELLGRCLRDEDPHVELYDEAAVVLESLDHLPASPLPFLWTFELALFRSLGFTLGLESCPLTGKPLAAAGRGPVRYRLADGAFLHNDVPLTVPHDGSISREAFAVLAKLPTASREFTGKLRVSPAAQSELTAFLTGYLEAHLPVRGKLRSLEALHWNKPFD